MLHVFCRNTWPSCLLDKLGRSGSLLIVKNYRYTCLLMDEVYPLPLLRGLSNKRLTLSQGTAYLDRLSFKVLRDSFIHLSCVNLSRCDKVLVSYTARYTETRGLCTWWLNYGCLHGRTWTDLQVKERLR